MNCTLGRARTTQMQERRKDTSRWYGGEKKKLVKEGLRKLGMGHCVKIKVGED